MAACCTRCNGQGYTREATQGQRVVFDICALCQGNGGWNEIDGITAERLRQINADRMHSNAMLGVR